MNWFRFFHTRRSRLYVMEPDGRVALSWLHRVLPRHPTQQGSGYRVVIVPASEETTHATVAARIIVEALRLLKNKHEDQHP